MRFVGYLFLLALIGYGLWPYYTVFQIDHAINQEGSAALGPLLDLTTLRANAQDRVKSSVGQLLPTPAPGSAAGGLTEDLKRFGTAVLDAGVEQLITPEAIRETLRESVTRVTRQSPPHLIGAIDYAFFETPNRFLIRLGTLGAGETHLRLTREGSVWKLTDLIR